MVKEVQLKVEVSGCTAQEFFDIIYKDDTAARCYHKEVNQDDNIKVSPWVDGRRTVEATLPLKLPSSVKSMLGTDKVPVVDEQELTLNGGDSFEVKSKPMLQIPGGSRFTTGAHVTVSNGRGKVVEIVAIVVCSASGIWGMQAFVEGIMAEQAKKGVQEFLDFCKAFVGTKLPGIVADDVASIGGSDVSDEFFDVQLGTEVDLGWDAADAGDEVLRVSNRGLASNVTPTKTVAHLEALLDKANRDLDAMSRKLGDMQQSLSKLERLAGATPWGLYFLTSLSLTLTLVLLYWSRRRN